MSLPVSCAISRAGITTLKAIVLLGRAVVFWNYGLQP
jgi:UDP-N-acetylglucosamine:LPS N-acetylglucosamine transferase